MPETAGNETNFRRTVMTDTVKIVAKQEPEIVHYDDDIVRKFVLATLIWAGVAMVVGLYASLELAYPALNFGLPWITFGRLRPVHTNAAIFAFAGNAMFAGIYHSSQRLLKTRMFSDGLSRFHFWGWQFIIVAAAITLPLGFTRGKEYAELEWPISIAIAVVWVSWGYNYYRTLRERREPHLYVSIWFYIATIVTVALLHVVNAVVIPVTLFKSYPVYSGVQDALVQWWYGHNAVAFVLTTPFLGLMYYYIPKASGKPVFSYRLSIIHFWSLVFIYIWAGPHHLLYTALPEWAQTMGMAFSIMLWIPSWGGMINGLLTLRGAWDKVKTDPVLKFLAAATIFYGMCTFEGPMLSIKSVSAVAHYTDWIIGHVHGGTLGWNGFLAFGMIYYLVPRLWKTELYSWKMADAHFWIGSLGTILYVLSMWISGLTQGLMWRALDASDKLVYPDFVESVVRVIPLYWARALGGSLYLIGFFIMAVNIAKTIAKAPKEIKSESATVPFWKYSWKVSSQETPHRVIEGLPGIFSVLVLLAVLVGTIVEIVPMLMASDQATPADAVAFTSDVKTKIRPYRALELAGRDIYVREGCYLCHSQMIRPMASEVLRYGAASEARESMYDHPFQWGSKRTGPDLARIGGKYPDLWHFRHLRDPREVVQQSIMPVYTWLFSERTDMAVLPRKLDVMRHLGVPYTDDEVKNADIDAEKQAKEISENLKAQGGPAGTEHTEIIAVIAYLQALGKMEQPLTSSAHGGAQ